MLNFTNASSAVTGNSPAAIYVNLTMDTYRYLASYFNSKPEADTSPLPEPVRERFSAYVAETKKLRPDAEVDAILASPVLREVASELRKTFGRVEFELERFYSRALTGQEPGVTDPRYTSFDNFVFAPNYDALVKAEMKAMGWPKKQPQIDVDNDSVAFVGAGPFPMSAIKYHLLTGHPVTCLDLDEEACRLGRNLIRHLSESDPKYASLQEKIKYVHAPGERYDYVTHPITFIASMVEKKDAVLMQVLRTTDSVSTVVIRNAEKLGALMYKPFNPIAGLEEYNFYLSQKTHLSGAAVNTSLVFKFPPGKMRTRNKVDFSNPLDTEGEQFLRARPRPMWRSRSEDASI